jgi:hypothetical protein
VTRISRGAALIAVSIVVAASIVAAATSPALASSRSSAATQLASAELPKAGEPAGEAGASGGKNALDDDAGCYRARKRLWVEGEGWIVRRVTTCR